MPDCVQAANAIECMKKIQNGDADLITLDGGEIYTAGNTEKIIHKITLEVSDVFTPKDTALYGLNRGMRLVRVWFSGIFFLK